MLQEKIDQEPGNGEIEGRLCGSTIFVSLSHVTEAKIMSVSSCNLYCDYKVESYLEGGRLIYRIDKPPKTNPQNPEEVEQWR